MKTLKKLTINPEKVIKNEKLVNLKGGYAGCVCICGNGQAIYGPLNQTECEKDCEGAGYGAGRWSC
jgi:natural product precursor